MKIGHKTSRKIIVISAVLMDAAIIVLADLLAFSIRYGIDVREENFAAYKRIAIFVVLLRLICLYIFGLYEKPKYKTNFENLANIVKAMTVSSLIIIAVAFYFRALAYPRSVILLSWTLTAALIMTWRLITKYLIGLILGPGYFVSHLLIVGTDRNALRLMLQLTRRAGIRCRLVGYVSTGSGDHYVGRERVLGDVEQIPSIIGKHPVDEMVISSADIAREKVAQIFSYITNTDIILKIVPDMYEAVIGKMAATAAEKVPLIEMTTSRYIRGWYAGFKRVLDIALSLAAITFTGPVLMAPIVLIIKIISPGPVLIRQERAGLHCRPFKMLKFRTMPVDSEKESGPVWTNADDRRAGRFGRFLRRTRLDELPQFFNVFKGEMSMVGPRPERPHFVRSLIRSVPFYTERMEVKPGITGWAQVNYKYASSLESNTQKLIYDLFYIENMSIALDLWIILKTLRIVLSGKGI